MDGNINKIPVQVQRMKISIIIPTLNEEKYIKKALDHILLISGNFEIIIVDGGSKDQTLQTAKKYNSVKVISSEKGRAIQMNSGAKIAGGDVFLFLHADTLLPNNAYNSIEAHLHNPDITGGSFKLKLDKRHPILKLYSWCSKLNVAFFTYGDHAMFFRKTIFEKIKGYKNIPLMEDVEIQNRVRKTGKFKKLDVFVITSARRFEKYGTLTQLTVDVLLVTAFNFGLSPRILKRFYKDHA